MKIKVLSCFFGQYPYEELFLKNIREYCNRWGYEFIYDRRDNDAPNNPYFEEHWFWWHNHTMILDNLDDCDYVMWIGTDCIILNMRLSIEKIVKRFRGDMIVVHEERPETGAFIVKNTAWVKKFFKDWKDYAEKGIRHNWDIKGHNNYIIFCKIIQWYDIQGHIKFVKSEDYMLKHVHIGKRTDNTLIMHVPGSTFEDKVHYMTQHSKEVSR